MSVPPRSGPGFIPGLDSPGLPGPPKAIGRYVIAGRLGAGNMGVVFRAHDPGLRRDVAIKILRAPASGADGDRMRRRFEREALAAARLRHRGIVPIHEVGEHEGQPFLAMGFVEGESFETLLESGRLGARRAVAIVRDIARALDYAHGEGVIHRDVKPGNVIIDTDGEARLADFGLARVSAQQQLTQTGQLLGTPGFMSPEQAGAAGVPFGPHTDVYSLGATLFFALGRDYPFRADGTVELIRAILLDPPRSLREARPEVSAELAAIVDRCLAKRPRDRWASAGELADALEPFAAGERPILGGAGRVRSRRPVLAGAALMAAAGVATATALVVSGRASPAVPLAERADRSTAVDAVGSPPPLDADADAEDAPAGVSAEADEEPPPPPDDPGARALAEAKSALADGRVDEARRQADELLTRRLLEPGDRGLARILPGAWRLLAECHERLGRADRAAELVERADAIERGDVAWLTARGGELNAKFMAGFERLEVDAETAAASDEAFLLWGAARELAPDDASILWSVGTSAQIRARWVVRTGGDPTPWVARSVACLESVTELTGDDGNVSNNIGVCWQYLYEYAQREGGDPLPPIDRAIAAFQRAVEIDAGIIDAWQSLGTNLFNRAQAHSRAGQSDASRADADACAEALDIVIDAADPTFYAIQDGTTHFTRGVARLLRGDADIRPALRDLRTAIAANPEWRERLPPTIVADVEALDD